MGKDPDKIGINIEPGRKEERKIRVATAQFEVHSGDKQYNLQVIEKLSGMASQNGAQVIGFHEMCITGYTFLKDLTREECFDLSEKVPDGESTKTLIQIAGENKVTILAGLLERDRDQLYNTYIAVDEKGLRARHRKLHPFINQCLSPGNAYTIFELDHWKCGILTCYDNNIIENVRATALLGAEIIFAPHVTMCTPSPFPGSGYVDRELWLRRDENEALLRSEFDGPKGRYWLLRWLPARAYDNGVYYVFSNAIGMEGDQLKNGNSMILDPFGEILTEIKSFNDEITIAECTQKKLQLAGGHRYKNARRPALYADILGQDHDGEVRPPWLQITTTK